MVVRFTNTEFEALTTSDVANIDLIGIMRDIQQDGDSWQIFEALMELAHLRAMNRVAGALQGIEMNTRPGAPFQVMPLRTDEHHG